MKHARKLATVRNTLVVLLALLFGFALAQDEEAVDGEAVYEASCASCHQSEGTGQEERFPALAGHVPYLYNADGGREYLMNVVMWGLSGEITVLGEVFDRSMPARFTLSNDELAAVLNYIMNAWDNADLITGEFEPFDADELAVVRRASRDWALQFRPAIDPNQ